MPAIQVDTLRDDASRREAMYGGDIGIFSTRSSVAAFCDYARRMASEAFAPHEPTRAQFDLSVEEYASILADFKPPFINSPESKQHVQELLVDFGCDPDSTYFDVPRIRTMTHGDYMRAGLAYQFHLHRDTWFSAPQQQLNWWLPVYEISAENTMAFHFEYWDRPIRNSSEIYDYEEWKRTGRKQAAKQVKKETREQPRALEEFDESLAVPVVCEVGELVLFSAAQLHGTVENTSGWTRFSIDFRTINRDDLEQGLGAPNCDSRCTGTTLGDFLRVSDLEPLPQSLIAEHAERARTADSISA